MPSAKVSGWAEPRGGPLVWKVSSISEIFLTYILFTISVEGEERRRREEGEREARRKMGGVT